MHPVLRAFSRRMAMVVVATCLPVFAVAFISMPLLLGGHPGEAGVAATTGERHLT